MASTYLLGVSAGFALVCKAILQSSPFSQKWVFIHFTGISPSYWDDLKAWADENMVMSRVIHFSNFNATLYVRPTAKVSGLSGGWITSHGLTLEAPTLVSCSENNL